MRTFKYAAWWAVAMATACSTTVSRAAVIYSDLADPVVTGNSLAIAGANTSSYQSFATPFVAPSNATVSEIDVAVYDDNGTRAMNVTLYANDPTTNLPGVSLAGPSTTATIPVDNPGIAEAATFADIPLIAGLTYWVAVTPGAGDTDGGWRENDSVAPVRIAASGDGQNFFSFGNAFPGQFQVIGVPEPTSLGAAGFLGLTVLRRRRAR